MQYLSAYAVALFVVVSPLAAEKRQRMNERFRKNYKRKLIILLSGFLSMRGSPPFLGFYVKVLVVQELLTRGHVALLAGLIRRAVFMLYAYMRFFYQAIAGSGLEAETGNAKYLYNGAAVIARGRLLGLPWL